MTCAPAPCTIDGCGRLVASRGWCMKHYTRWRRHGDPQAPRPPRPPKQRAACSIEGCRQLARTRGWCPTHYKRWQLYGDPRAPDKRNHRLACTVDGCGEKHVANGLCERHYAPGRSARRRALLLSLAEHHTAGEWFAELAAYGGRCAYCGAPATSRDHLVPLTKGGTNTIDNIVPACRSCNSSKGNRPTTEWLAAVP